MHRRDFLARAALALGAGRAAGLAVARVPRTPIARPIVIDGLGEIHADYDAALLDAMRASGMRGCVVTVGNPALQGAEALDDLRREVAATDAMIARQPARLARALGAADLARAAERETIGLVYYTQNAAPLGDDASRLEELHRLGVRIVQLTYNTRNLLGDGCLERTNAGLSRFGAEVVERMHAMRMLVDASHCGAATTMDAITMSRAPIAITHAGCSAVYEHPRNKSDVALRALAERGGVVGIYQINPYLGARERNTLDDYVRHIEHAIRIAGIDHVGIGSDREHRAIPDTPEEKQKLVDELSRLRPATASTFRWPFFIAELNHPRRMETIRRALERRGHPAAAIDRILGENWLRLFREVL